MALAYLTGILIVALTTVNSLFLLYILGDIFELAP